MSGQPGGPGSCKLKKKKKKKSTHTFVFTMCIQYIHMHALLRYPSGLPGPEWEQTRLALGGDLTIDEALFLSFTLPPPCLRIHWTGAMPVAFYCVPPFHFSHCHIVKALPGLGLRRGDYGWLSPALVLSLHPPPGAPQKKNTQRTLHSSPNLPKSCTCFVSVFHSHHTSATGPNWCNDRVCRMLC